MIFSEREELHLKDGGYKNESAENKKDAFWKERSRPRGSKGLGPPESREGQHTETKQQAMSSKAPQSCQSVAKIHLQTGGSGCPVRSWYLLLI